MSHSNLSHLNIYILHFTKIANNIQNFKVILYYIKEAC